MKKYIVNIKKTILAFLVAYALCLIAVFAN